MDENEIKSVTTIILLSGHCKVPYRKLHWTVVLNTHNVVVPNPISRQRFRDIFSNLHLTSNAEINADQ